MTTENDVSLYLQLNVSARPLQQFFSILLFIYFFGNMPVTILYIFKLHFLHRLCLDSFISREHFQTASVSLSTLLKMAGQSQKEKFQFVCKTVSLGLLLQ